MLVLAGLAQAGVTFDRPKAKVETTDPGSMPAEEAKVRDWRARISDRATYASLDRALAWRADEVEACLRAGNTPAAEAVVALSLTRDGVLGVRRTSGDEPLVTCVSTAFVAPLFMPVFRSLSGSVTVKWDPSTTPLPTPPPLAIDREDGFAVFAWGDPSTGAEGMSYDTAQSSTTFMTRNGEYQAYILGARASGGRYGFDSGAFYTTILHFSGSTDAWKVRDTLTKIYGPSKWDTSFNSYYWRGDTNLLLYRVASDEDIVVTVMNIERARKSGLADRLPGDKSAGNNATSSGRRLPKTYKAGEKPAEEPAETEPAEPSQPPVEPAPTP